MSFQLYDVLKKESENKNDISESQKKDLITIIEHLDQIGIDNIYILIRVHYSRTNENGNIFDIPYEGRKNDKLVDGKIFQDIKFNIDKLPKILRVIIYNFCKKHKDIMIKEKEREEKGL